MENGPEEMDQPKQEESEQDSEEMELATQKELEEDLKELEGIYSWYEDEPIKSLYGRDDLDDTEIKDPIKFFFMKQDYRHTKITETEERKMKEQNPFPNVMMFMSSGKYEFYRTKESLLDTEEIEHEVNPLTDSDVDNIEPKNTTPKADNPHVGTNFHTPWQSLLRLTTIVSDLLSIKDRCGRGCACASCRGALHVLV